MEPLTMAAAESANGDWNRGGANGRLGRDRDQRPLSLRAEDIQKQLQALASRDVQLWSIVVLMIVVLSAGLAALIAPHILWRPATFPASVRFLPQLLFGLISLVLLFNIYVISQKRELNNTRTALVQELISNERLEELSLLDPLTQLLNRRAMEEMVAREVARANRIGSSLTILMLDMDNFKAINTRSGHQAGDKFLVEAAQLLRSTFRGSDLVFRYGGDEFLAVLPDTTEQQAEVALARLSARISRWNAEHRPQEPLAITWGMATYVKGANFPDVLEMANRRMFIKKHKLVPVF